MDEDTIIYDGELVLTSVESPHFVGDFFVVKQFDKELDFEFGRAVLSLADIDALHEFAHSIDIP